TVAHIGSIATPVIALVLMALAVLLMGGLDLFGFRTQFGAALRATAQDREAASLMGIDGKPAIVGPFLPGAPLARLGGVLAGLPASTVDFFMGYLIGIKAFTAAVIGGIGNVRGAMVGGFLLGVLESLGGGFVSTAFQDTFAFMALILVLLLRPQGLFGERPVERA